MKDTMETVAASSAVATIARRPYQKPMLMVESLTMTQSIAANCSAAATGNSGSPAACSMEIYGIGNVFTAATTQPCAQEIDENSVGTYCYNNPTAGSQLFNS